MNEKRHAIRSAILFSFLAISILFAPLLIYAIYLKNIYEMQNEFELKQRSSLIIDAMEDFDKTSSEVFLYPRFETVQSGLYDLNFNPIFTLIDIQMDDFSSGYHIYKENSYLIVPLEEGRYFGANYIILTSKISYSNVYQKVGIVLLSILVFLFVLSFSFLNYFALPFKKINQQLDNFMKDSMHDINTTLNIININVDLYNRKNPNNKYLQRIKAATKALSNIYKDVDYLIKVDQKSLIYKKIDASRVINDSILYFYEVAAIKNIQIISNVEDNVFLIFNETKLQRIIDNSLSNAIKYSHKDSKVEVVFKRVGSEYQLIFKDYGIGIDYDHRIFERYYRENNNESGFGIGLDIVKAIIDKAGIQLKVTSKINEGSTFTYIFPKKLIST